MSICVVACVYTNRPCASLPRQIQPWLGLFILERLIDTYFCIDIVINFRTAWIDDEGP